MQEMYSIIFLAILLLTSVMMCTKATSTQGKPKPNNDSEVRQMLNDLLTDYDCKLRPNYLGPPVHISVDATILSFTNLDAINMMYTVDMFFRQQWKDHRLAHSLNKTLTIIVGTKHPSDIIWTPDTVFENSVTSSMHHVTVNNHKVDLYPDGTVFWGTRVTVSPSCYLNLRSYPMDVQHCMFKIGSYAYDTAHLMYQWKKQPGILILDTKMAQFELEKFETVEKHTVYVAGNYTVLIGKFKFRRQMGFAVLQIYVPSIAIVSVSWISLWIRRNATPARVGLCITTLLTISTIWASVNATLPRVNYVKAIDIFLMTSFVCVILTLLEYTLVLNSGAVLNLLRRKMKRKKEREKELPLLSPHFMTNRNNNGLNIQAGGTVDLPTEKHYIWNPRASIFSKRDENEEKQEEQLTKKRQEEDEKFADKIEMFARVFFPFCYMLFNVFYWTNYLLAEDVPEESLA